MWISNFHFEVETFSSFWFISDIWKCWFLKSDVRNESKISNFRHNGYNCSCREGFEGDGKTCTEKELLNECKLPETSCGENAECVDTRFSYECKCKNGFKDLLPNLKHQTQCVETFDCCKVF